MTWERPDAYRSLTIDLTDADSGWIALARSPDAQEGFLSLFADGTAARRWFDRSLPRLVALQSAAGELLQPAPARATSLIHLDLRSDNLLFRPDGAPVLLDWPYVTKGPVVLDTVFFAPSIEGEGGLAAAETVALFEQALAFAAGYFADKAWLPTLPGLPRLRWVQRLQLAVCLGWATKLIGLAEAPMMIGQSAS